MKNDGKYNSQHLQHLARHYSQQNFEENISSDNKCDDDNWLLSYIDVFTLLLALFVVMLSFSSPDVQEAKGSYPGPELIRPVEIKQHKKSNLLAEPQASDSSPDVQEAKGSYPSPESIRSVEIKQQKKSNLLVEPQASEEKKLLDHFKKTLHGLTEQGSVELSMSKKGIALQLGEKILFESGDTELLREGRKVLNVIIPSLRDSKHLINVQGHTDNMPISNEEFPSNWELSGARASSVVRYLISRGISAGRLSATGFSDTISIADNNVQQGRARNRRVTLLIKLD